MVVIHTPLVYGIKGDDLILLPETIAAAYAGDHRSIFGLRTYGDARRFKPKGMNPAPGLDEEELDEDDVPDDSDPYDATSTPEYENGDWPPSVATISLSCLPEDLSDVGQEKEQFPNSPILHIDPATEAELIKTLVRRGYTVRRDDDLISSI